MGKYNQGMAKLGSTGAFSPRGEAEDAVEQLFSLCATSPHSLVLGNAVLTI